MHKRPAACSLVLSLASLSGACAQQSPEAVAQVTRVVPGGPAAPGPAALPATADCSRSARDVYTPSLEPVMQVAASLQVVAEGTPYAPGQYMSEPRLLLDVGPDGDVRRVGFAASSRNRKLDQAAQAWGEDLRFSPRACGDEVYQVIQPVQIAGGAGH